MKAIGQAPSTLVAPRAASRRALALAVLGLACALGPALFMWGFTVDDALISARYAVNLASGAGYRFAAAGPATDGVTPLPWPLLLAALAHLPGAGGAPLAVTILTRAKALGVALGALGGARLGWALSGTRAPLGHAAAALLVCALSVPLAAHSASGMETSLATCLLTFAATSRRALARGALAGLAASLRPELLPWALTLAALSVQRGPRGSSPRARAAARAAARALAGAVVAAATPFALCVVARLVAFGRPAPLALLAKPSDVAHGLPYAAAALIASLTPLLVVAPSAARGARRGVGARGRALVVAACVHAGVIVAVGGDWMPYARLMAPLVPGLAFAACAILPGAGPRVGRARAWSIVRLVVAAGLGVVLFAGTAPRGRGVWRDRLALIARARPELAGARGVAALDIGWVSAATDAPLLDLAGLTDPELAALPGGHTSKRVATSLLLDRGVDVALVYTTAGGMPAPGASQVVGARGVEARLVGSELFARRYAPSAFVRLGDAGAGYVVYRRVPEKSE